MGKFIVKNLESFPIHINRTIKIGSISFISNSWTKIKFLSKIY